MFTKRRPARDAAAAMPGRTEPVEMTPGEAADYGAFRDDCVELDDVLAADEEPEGESSVAGQD